MSSVPPSKSSRFKQYAAFFKLRLASLVVFSACLGYLLAEFNTKNMLTELICLSLGGFLVTGASNGINQIIERKLDALMSRTSGRPLPTGGMSVLEAWIAVFITAFLGLFLLAWGTNTKAALLALMALLCYAFVYTPLKQKSPFSVFIGAFPGAVPPMLGWVAASNQFDAGAGILYAVQFLWQFPHFWAIAWVLDDDYNKGGFRLLPSPEGRHKSSAFQILMYTLFTVPVSILPWVFGLTGLYSLIVSLLMGVYFCYYAFTLYFSCQIADARKLMFASFVYLPVIQIVYVLDKI